MVDSVISNQVALKKGWYIHPKLARPVKNFSWRQGMSRWLCWFIVSFSSLRKSRGFLGFPNSKVFFRSPVKLDKINIMFQSNNAVINLLSLALSKTPWRLKWNRQIYGPDFFQLSLKTFIEIGVIQVKTTGYTDDSYIINYYNNINMITKNYNI